ncbi:unnamed protein product [Durusdinium trenchii]|uniref:Glycosyltransferase 61 catalytic domain-containing protein n=1 Tax=Durusdinium trenchii TaxID=1381693 RepID=A0ABP0HDH1_9DINO
MFVQFLRAWPLLAFSPATFADPSDCWSFRRSRALCCYDLARKEACFSSVEDMERCCGDPVSRHIHEMIYQLLPSDDPQVPFLARLRSVHSHKSHVAAAFFVHEFLKQALLELKFVENHTILGELPFMRTAFQVALRYFLCLHVLHRFLRTPRFVQAILRREDLLWSGFTRIYFAAWGARDFCRCVEAGEFFSRTGAQLLQAGVGRAHFPQVFLNSSSIEHQALSLQNCRLHTDMDLEAGSIVRTAFFSQCIPGDLSTLLSLLHGCILEQDLTKVLLLHEGIFQLATFAQDCLDIRTWEFSVRDAALHYARLVWLLLQNAGQQNRVIFGARLQKRIAWARRSSLFGQRLSSPGTGSAWYSQCGPHTLHLVQLLSPSHNQTRHGPLCTEFGRFWLYLNHLPRPVEELQADSTNSDSGCEAEATAPVLLVIPITMSWEANPWHHLHWWIPVIWYSKIFLQLQERDTDVALVFPHAETDWAISTAEGRKLDWNFRGHTEPSIWSILQHDFPFKTEEAMMHWRVDSKNLLGLHADLLKWISERPARPLAKYYGCSYGRVILGLPSLRSFLQTPQLTCAKLDQVKQWVQGTPGFNRQTSQPSAAGLTLAVLQRPQQDGRRIQNYDEVMDFVSRNFKLQIKEVEGLSHGTPWVEQFRQFVDADILLAVHGAGLAWLWALRRGGAVVELRSQSSPVWLQCSDLWNNDYSQIFGGLARLAGIHHLCTRPHDVKGSLKEARLSNIGDMSDADAYNHSDDVFVALPKAESILHSAISIVHGEPLPCLNYHWWI